MYAAVSDNGPTLEPYFNETWAVSPSLLPRDQQVALKEPATRARGPVRGPVACCGLLGMPPLSFLVQVVARRVSKLWWNERCWCVQALAADTPGSLGGARGLLGLFQAPQWTIGAKTARLGGLPTALCAVEQRAICGTAGAGQPLSDGRCDGADAGDRILGWPPTPESVRRLRVWLQPHTGSLWTRPRGVEQTPSFVSKMSTLAQGVHSFVRPLRYAFRAAL